MATPNVGPHNMLSFPESRMHDRNQSRQFPQQSVEPTPENLSREPDHELFVKLKQWFEEGRDRTQKWRQEAEQAFDLTAGWQWDADDMQVLADDNRPTVTFNRIGRNIDLISGMEVQGREEVAFLPREQGDVGKSEVLSAAVQYVNDETDAADEKSDAFRDLCICGMGWTNTVMDYRDFEEGMPVESRINPLSMYWDPHADKRNLKDTRWRARAIIIPTIEAMRLFPGTNAGMLNAPWAQIADDPSQPSEPDRQSYNYEDSPTIGRPPLLDRSTIIEMQWWEVEEQVLVQDLFTGERIEMKKGRAQDLMNSFVGRYQGLPVERKVYHRAFLGGILLGKMRLEKVKDFTYQCMTGKRDRRAGWYGMVRLMADPQRWANKWLSQSMHIMNTGAKNTIMYEEGSFIDGPRAERDLAKPGALVETAAGAISEGRIQPVPSGQFPQELHSLLPFALQSIQDCVGVTSEQLGATAEGSGNAQRAAMLEQERRKAGITLMANLFDAKKLFVKRQGRVMLRYILEFMNDGRLIRIQQEGNKQYAQLIIEDPQSVRYDIVVDDAPDSPNQKDKTWAIIERLMPVMERLDAPPEIWLDSMRYSPLPASLVDKWQKSVEQAQQQDQGQEVDPKAEIDAAKLPAEIAKLQADTERLMAAAQELQTRAALNVAKTEETGMRVEIDSLEGVRETIAVEDARQAQKLTTHEAA